MGQYRPLKDLLKISRLFRNAIESIPASERPINLQGFPAGACGDAVLLLGTYLIELGEAPFHYMLGDTTTDRDDPKWSSHAWMQRDRLVIDITADQFDGIDEGVIVATDSSWHDSLNGEELHVADFNVYEQNTFSPLGGFYQEIKRILQRGD